MNDEEYEAKLMKKLFQDLADAGVDLSLQNSAGLKGGKLCAKGHGNTVTMWPSEEGDSLTYQIYDPSKFSSIGMVTDGSYSYLIMSTDWPLSAPRKYFIYSKRPAHPQEISLETSIDAYHSLRYELRSP